MSTEQPEHISEDMVSKEYLEKRLAPTEIKPLVLELFSKQWSSTFHSIKSENNSGRLEGLEHLTKPNIELGIERLPGDTEIAVEGKITDNLSLSEQLRYTVAEFKTTYTLEQLGINPQNIKKQP